MQFKARATDFFETNKAKISGLALGVFGSALLMAFLSVAYSGQPLGGDRKPVEQIYFF